MQECGSVHILNSTDMLSMFISLWTVRLSWRNSAASPEVFFQTSSLWFASMLLTWMLVVVCWRQSDLSTVESCIGFPGRCELFLSLLQASWLWACWKQGDVQGAKLELMHLALRKVHLCLCGVQAEHVQVCLWKPQTHPLKTASLWMKSLIMTCLKVLRALYEHQNTER